MKMHVKTISLAVAAALFLGGCFLSTTDDQQLRSDMIGMKVQNQEMRQQLDTQQEELSKQKANLFQEEQNRLQEERELQYDNSPNSED